MKKLVYLFILIIYNFNTIAQENTLYVMIDSKYKSFYKFKKEINQDKDYYFSSIKILKDSSKNEGFINKDISQKNDDDIVIVKTQPISSNFYEFESYKKPQKVNNIDSLKLHSIRDLSKNIEVFKEIWGNYKYSLVFIENKNCNYILWRMKPVYLE
jgi:superfamily I DNA/RNA helicase